MDVVVVKPTASSKLIGLLVVLAASAFSIFATIVFRSPSGYPSAGAFLFLSIPYCFFVYTIWDFLYLWRYKVVLSEEFLQSGSRQIRWLDIDEWIEKPGGKGGFTVKSFSGEKVSIPTEVKDFESIRKLVYQRITEAKATTSSKP